MTMTASRGNMAERSLSQCARGMAAGASFAYAFAVRFYAGCFFYFYSEADREVSAANAR